MSEILTSFNTTLAPLLEHGRRFSMSAVAIPADRTFGEWVMDTVVWLPEKGMGFSGSALRAPSIYDESYWSNYEQRAATPMGARLSELRIHTVNRYLGDNGELVDVGIGCGDFITRRGHTYGYDVNPVAVEWLRQRNLWFDPYAMKIKAASFWDVLEHIHDPAQPLANVDRFAFISMPIYQDGEHVLRSKHYKPNEHIWYWSRDGLIGWMRSQGFECVEHGTPESLLGREAIESFVFERRP